ncbi:unnamed protein product [Strongylus vulgaris]|uniref:Heparan sulfate-N-deacetylase N-terminal domain-containing protein n=1 Tax=Strongylus vulgaris TaxID=40348 RepID=A0A3P7IPH7_STRVU|nr:unnamed protein product [Strongylus vulgaris]
MLPYSTRRLLKSLKLLLSLIIVASVLFLYNVSLRQDSALKRYPPQNLPPYQCPCTLPSRSQKPQHINRNLTEHRALVLLESAYSRHGRLLQQILGALKYPFKAETLSKNLPLLTTATKGRYAVIIIENYYKYLSMASWNRQLLDKYCADYDVPLISFLVTFSNTTFRRRIEGSKLHFWQNQEVTSLKVVESSVHRIAKIGAERSDISSREWTLFEESPPSSTVSVEYGTKNTSFKIFLRSYLQGMFLVDHEALSSTIGAKKTV